tara:strand:- start:396 stop:764 length:369 start_codon:yes stop_codon:yes gene_type:complete
MIMTLQQQARQLKPKNIPADIKLVEESEIDVENIQAGLEHKLFYQRIEKQTAVQNYLQKIAEKKASLARAKAEYAKKWWWLNPENILVTTNCPICAHKCLLRIERPVCSACENKYELRGVVA